MRRAALLLLAWLAMTAAAQAQLATLIADNIRFDGRDRITATGHVEIFYDGNRLLARQLTYDAATDTLDLVGPITLFDGSGQILTAEFAELSRDLTEGIVRGARLVIAEQMQIAAAEGHRIDGRYNQLYKAVASSCQVCEHNPTPLWRIRAEKIVHDEQERMLYFTNARFEIAGVPVFWAPRLRMPDPSRRRASGFLIPSFTQNSTLGFGFRFPYFQTLGDHADITFTPYVTGNARTAQVRYRHALRWGNIELNGAVSRDEILPDETRAYLFGRGVFDLPGEFKLNVNVETVTDRAYLATYDFSDQDRLSNGFEVTRTRRHEHIRFRFEALRTLRDNEEPIQDTLATNLGRGTYERRFPYVLGGEARLIFDLQGYEREAESVTPALLNACATVDPAIPVSECIARDVFRATAEAGWHRDWTFASGVIARVEGAIAGDYYIIGQDTAFPQQPTRITPAASVELRWPLARQGARGGRSLLQPVVQLAWSESHGDPTPNEDSRLVEFDEGNFLALSHFPGRDAREEGTRASAGLSWTHFAPSGREYALAVARIFRDTDPQLFSGASGLDGENSDWLVAGRMEFTETLSLNNRTIFDDRLDVAKSETRLTYAGSRFSGAMSYIWVEAATFEGRGADVSEWNVDVAYRVNRHWTGRASWRYDLIEGAPATAAIGVGYRNECVNLDLSLSRRFTSSTNVAASTDVGFTVSLNGFGRDGRPYARGCTHVEG